LLLYIFAAIAAVALVLERVIPVRPQPFLRRGLVTDGVYVVVNIILRVAFTGSIAIVIEDAGRGVVPAQVVAVLRDDPLWLQAIAVVVVLDLFFYWMHRAKHRFDWWWRLHEAHHSSRDLDWFSSVRVHPLEKILDRSIYLAPLLFLGVSNQALLILASLDAVVATISHANVRLRFGSLSYVFVGPEMHRLHHARASTAQRCNFGNNLSIFDWLFGTAVLPETIPEDFGLDDEAYPEGNIVRQFFYAFRPFPVERSPDSDAPLSA